jgi:hypothetical protein
VLRYHTQWTFHFTTQMLAQNCRALAKHVVLASSVLGCRASYLRSTDVVASRHNSVHSTGLVDELAAEHCCLRLKLQLIQHLCASVSQDESSSGSPEPCAVFCMKVMMDGGNNREN